ncbi:hypothetical protein K9B33_11180 [Sphingobium sp. 3R8]|uniref:hypothetical protein n=1 Tax=Sphingobium sp. 3R8 TaxID=2874921 RepID=UPI001CCD55A7|nr:hypothetical protein [Sphingobium sp. 3R8]MBZ9648111.1 hypothetical protein [Sphingobium sp. 3R8]
MSREEGAGTAPGKKADEAVARRKKACGKPRSIKAAGVAETMRDTGMACVSGQKALRQRFIGDEIVLA